MSVRAFGETALRIGGRIRSDDAAILICEPPYGDAALAAAVDLRRRGQPFFAAIVWDDERSRLARIRSRELCAQYRSWDEIRLAFHAFADALDERAAYPLSARDRSSLHEFVRLSQGLLVGSFAERDSIQVALGTIAREVDVVAIEPAAPAAELAEPSDVVVYAPHEHGDAFAAYVTALGDLALPVTIVALDAPQLAPPAGMRFVPPVEAAAALARARVIVDAGTIDPGTSLMLAQRGRPLAVSSRSGATEFVRNVMTFEPWHRPSILAAVADALAAGAPRRRTAPLAELPPRRFPIDRPDRTAPLVSVIVTTYNRPAVLARTLATIERQTYPALEIVVVNDAGADVGAVVARSPRARLVTHETNRGPAAARNSGLREARGPYVTFFDDDDEMFPEHIDALAGALERSGLDVAYGQMLNGFATADDDGRYHLDAVLAHYALLDHAEIQWGGNLATTAVMFRRRLVDEIGYVDETLVANEDFDFWMRLAAGREWARIPDVTSLYYVRTDGTNRSSQNAKERYLAAHRAIFARHPSARALVHAGRQAMLELFGTTAPV